MTSEKYEILRQETILSQYSASPHILGLTEQMAGYIDPTDNISLFYRKIFDIETAEGYGLDVWGVILALPREIVTSTSDWFGYDQSLLQPFNNAPFFNPLQASDHYEISDEIYRKALMFKARVNIGNTTAAEISGALSEVLGLPVGVIDNGNMTITIRVPVAQISDEYRLILNTYGKGLAPAGVGVEIEIFDPLEGFGFRGSEMNTFDNGVFDVAKYRDIEI